MSLKLKKIAVVLAFFGFTNMWAADCSRDGSIYNTLLCRNKCPLGSSACFYSCKADYDYECKATKLTPKDELALNAKRSALLIKRATEPLDQCYVKGNIKWQDDQKKFNESGEHLNYRIYSIGGEDFVFIFKTILPSGWFGIKPYIEEIIPLSLCFTKEEDLASRSKGQSHDNYKANNLWDTTRGSFTDKEIKLVKEKFVNEIEDSLKANP